MSGSNPINLGGARVPYLDQWLGYWFIDADRGAALFSAMRQLDLAVHLRSRAAGADGDDDEAPAVPPGTPADAIDYERPPPTRRAYGYRVVDGVALIDLNGVLMKHEASAVESTSTVMMRRTVRKLWSDPAAKAVVVSIDSPGGTVSGAYELADDLATLARLKPVHVHASNLIASAAYLMAAGATSLSASPSALVGSLGIYTAVYDSSTAAAQAGVKAHLIKGRVDGKVALMKGAGTPGTEITAEQLARMQEAVDDLNAQFIQAVENGPRKPPPAAVEGWFLDAGVWIAAKAKASGLIDRVESLDDTLARVTSDVTGKPAPLAGRRPDAVPDNESDPGGAAVGSVSNSAGPPARKDEKMDGNNTAGAVTQPPAVPVTPPTEPAKPAAATLAELRAGCPGASSDFILAHAEKGATLAEAKDAFIQFQAAQIRARDEDLAKAKDNQTGAAKASVAAPRGNEPVSFSPPEGAKPAAAKVGILTENTARFAAGLKMPAEPANN